MAALLKKRAVAEFTKVIQEEPIPTKKIRLYEKPASHELVLDLHSARTSQEVYNSLVIFSSRTCTDIEIIQNNIRTLIDQFYKQKEAYIRSKIVSVLGSLISNTELDVTMIVDDIIALLKTEESHMVTSQLLKTLLQLGKALPNDKKLHCHLVELAVGKLKDSSYLVRCRSLKLIGSLGLPMSPSSQAGDIFKLLQDSTFDQDPRVRTSAFDAIHSCHERGIKIDVSIYRHVCSSLSDDYEGVRIAAIRLIYVLSQTYPDIDVKVEASAEDLKLIDDSFANICNMVNDLSMKVRVEAAGLLGSMTKVSAKFLEQTLDKKLMSNMRRKGSAHERQKAHYLSGEWSTGQKWADDAPKEQVNVESVSLMSSGACGAFVHGLEDEFLEVRHAAINSLCNLACGSRTFAQLSQDFLVDMFNDEIESVRLHAINSLQRLGSQLTLREDQLDVILGCLKDFSYEIREALREMFCQTRLATRSCLKDCVMALLDNMKRYPQDRQSIWECMQHIGRNHPALTSPLVPEFLNTHPYFDTPEPDMDDPAYISILILVFNASRDYPSMVSLFPEHTARHYQYLRNSLPDMVPKLQLSRCESQTMISEGNKPNVSDFLKQTMARLEIANNLDNDSVQELLLMVVRDLERISEVDPSLSATTECTAMILQCQLLLSQISIIGSSSMSQNHSRIEASLDKIFHLTTQLRHLFIGMSPCELSAIHELQLRGRALQLLHFPEHRQVLCERFIKSLEEFQQFSKEHEIPQDHFVQTLLLDLTKLETNKCDLLLTTIRSALSHRQQFGIGLVNLVKRCKVHVNEPLENTDNPVKFTAGLTLAVPINVVLDNVTSTDNIKVQIMYPDKRRQLFKPRPEDFKKTGDNKYRLQTEALVSHAVWIEPSCVEVSVVLCVNNIADSDNNNNDVCLDLCKPIKIIVAPRQIKKF